MKKAQVFLAISLFLLFTGCTTASDEMHRSTNTNASLSSAKESTVSVDEATATIASVFNDSRAYINYEGDNIIDGKTYYNIYANSTWFVVDIASGLPYVKDINTDELIPVGKLRYLFKTSEEYEMAEQKGQTLFPNVYFGTWFVEREGKEYCIYSVPNKPTLWTSYDYFYYDLASGNLFRWDIDNDTLMPVDN